MLCFSALFFTFILFYFFFFFYTLFDFCWSKAQSFCGWNLNLDRVNSNPFQSLRLNSLAYSNVKVVNLRDIPNEKASTPPPEGCLNMTFVWLIVFLVLHFLFCMLHLYGFSGSPTTRQKVRDIEMRKKTFPTSDASTEMLEIFQLPYTLRVRCNQWEIYTS